MRPQPDRPDDDTMPLPRIHAPSPAARAATPASAEPRLEAAHGPVFVDSTGRRQRRVRRAGRLLVIPAAAYVVLLISALFGGPAVRAPFLPAPHTPDAVPSRAPVAEAGPASGSPSHRATPVGGAPRTAASSAAPKPATATTGAPAPAPPSGAAPTPTGGPTQAVGPTARGKSTSAPGQGAKPTSHP
ncbi:hypothetical protein [Streptomyces sp. NPDC091268]|uniref:hypothetical protein n=1 Tax=Streptomyces sp. NPDC091268 TaxID=3365979 RepID=UPI003822A062